jgi:hypothetical protein
MQIMRTLLPALCLLLAACTQTTWQKPLTGSGQAQADLAACSAAAQRDALVAAPHPPPGPRLLPLGHGDLENPAWDVPEELLLQQSLRNRCMRERGYNLAPQQATAP